MKKKFFALLTIIILLFAALCACAGGEPTEPEQPTNEENSSGEEQESTEEIVMKITINGRTFTAKADGSAAAQAFARLLPLDVTMSELNGNEKYYYLDEPLPQNAQRVGRIEAGDIMLWGDDCVVIFYESFSTPYSYTRLGRIENAEGLKEAAGAGAAQVTFEKE